MRARTTLAVTAVVGVAIAVAGAALVGVLHDSMVHDIQQVAELHASDVADAVEQRRLVTPIQADDDEIVQVVDSAGRVRAASANVAGRPSLAPTHPVGAEPAAWTVSDPLGVPGQFRLVAVSLDATPPTTVFVATSLKFADETEVLLRRALLVAAPLLLVLVAGMTWFGVGVALRPVEAIRAEVDEISGLDLSRRVRVSGSQDEIGRLARTMNVMLDRLQSAATRQRRFVADASHELQSPLAAMRTDLEVSLAHPDKTAWPLTAQRVLDRGVGMQRLVGDLLFVARLDDAPFLVDARPVDLHEVVRSEADELGRHGHVAVDTAAVAPAFVRGRRDDLARAVRNLLDNAGRHAAGTVTVSLHGDGRQVTLVVADDGPGIPAAERARVFERFARIDAARNASSGGTGLGLAIVRDVVEHHGGRVRLDDALGGARFVITLPAD